MKVGERRVIKDNKGWVITQVRQSDGSWWNITITWGPTKEVKS